MAICETINTLGQATFIAGSRQVYEFECFYSDGTEVNLNTAQSFGLKISPLNNPSYTTLTRSGTLLDTNIYSVTLLYNDTKDWDGYYLMQPYLVDVYGRTYHPTQGTLFVSPMIG